MSSPAPVLTVRGRVHSVVTREVPSRDALPETRDPETNRVVQHAQPAREGYTATDVTVLTEHGGFCTVVALPDAVKALGGEIPAAGSEAVELLARPFVSWRRGARGSFASVGLSLAGPETAALRSAGSEAGRRALASTG